MKNTVIFGGTGGVGSILTEYFKNEMKDKVTAVGSSICNITDYNNSRKFIADIKPDNLIILTAVNMNGFLHKQGFEQIKAQIDVNILGVVNLISETLEYMRKQKYGRIILASSIIEEVTQPGTSIYASCKGFYETIVKNIARENAAYNITANCLKLGYMEAGMTFTQLTPEFRESIRNTIPSKEFGSIEQVYNICQTIINNNYINGSTIRMAGGL